MKPMKFEYVRLDGYTPEPNLRGKTNIIPMDSFDWDVSKLPHWSYDGSSTKQATGDASDCVLVPVKAIIDVERKDAWIVLCEVYNADGTPHATNIRATIDETASDGFWFGFEQEYVLAQNGRPIHWPAEWYPEPQGKYYCGVWYSNMGDLARKIVEEHLDFCLQAGINITCINSEVLKWQWEYGVLSFGAKAAGDDVRLARYIMMRIGEKYGVDLVLTPKPVKGDRNGTWMHCNFSNTYMREKWDEKYFIAVCEMFGKYREEHIAVYGSGNEERLTGAHETQSIHQFSYGISDRWASIRIPLATVQDGWKGRLEDRRVAANADPYKVVARVVKTVHEVPIKQ